MHVHHMHSMPALALQTQNQDPTDMNLIRPAAIASSLLIAAALSGCSTFDSVLGKFKKSDSTAKTEKTEAPAALQRPAKKKNSTVKKDAVLPTDREQIRTDKATKTFNPAELSRGVIDGDWAIDSIEGRRAVGEVAPFLKFEPKQHMVYGNNGCNTINASYTYNPADSTLRFANIVATMRACATEGITDYDINRALDATRFYRWELRDSQYYMYMLDASHRVLLTLLHQNFEFLNGTWAVVAIDEEPVENTDMRLVIDVAELKVHGNTGCNILNGRLDTDMESPNAISFADIAMTRMACDDPSRETQFVVALENATYARPVSPTKVLLIDPAGKVVLTLVRPSE